ncbi:MAG: TetR/AcrR family transcriptional regulator [Deltaproteobacteria bacterium]|nr:TetR/AcrR family transcriptional regulator [Deltaproteobacteria bacterium]MBW2648844.1 TetR/AcrR family transcriptional regulator [Deltaproteobacteria bacterium]
MDKKNTFNELRQREREARKDVIVDAAERVFASKPFNKVSMRDIAREAGISPASIYHYFPDQQTLFVDAFLRGAKEITEILGDIIDKDSELCIENAAEEFIDYLSVNDQYFRMMTHFMLDGSLSDESLESLNQHARSLIDQFDNLFRKVMPDSNPRLLSHAFFAAMNGILITFRDYPGRSREEVSCHMKLIGRIMAGMLRKELTSSGQKSFS